MPTYHKKLSIVMIVLSEEYWIEENLKQHYSLAEEIIIVEGAVPQAIADGLADGDGASIDRTAEIIESFPDPENKIKFVRVGKIKHRNALRDKCLVHITGNWVLIIDADEFYKKKDFDSIRTSINNADNEGYEMIWYGFTSFVTWEMGMQSAPMERLFKFSPDLSYPDIDTGQTVFKKGLKLWSQNKYSIPIRCWHYNRICENRERLFRKMRYYLVRDQGKKCETINDLPARDRDSLEKTNLEKYGFHLIPINEHPEQIIKKHHVNHTNST